METMKILPTIAFKKGAVELIDQTLLPLEYKILRLARIEDLCEAIKALRIRGAPALGVAGAYGLLLAVEEKWRQHDGWYFDDEGTNLDTFPEIATTAAVQQNLDRNAKILRGTRPTAVNLGWAIDRMKQVYARVWENPRDML